MSAKTVCLTCGAVREGRSVDYPFPIGEPVPVVPGAVELTGCQMCDEDDKYVSTSLPVPTFGRRRAAA